MRAPLALGVIAALLVPIPAALAQTPLGPELSVSDDPERFQHSPEVAMGREGGLALVWRDATRWESSLRLLEIDANGLGSAEIRFDDHGLSTDWPDVELSSHGDLALTWFAGLAEGGVAMYGRTRLRGDPALAEGVIWQEGESEGVRVYGYSLGSGRDGSLAIGLLGISSDDEWADLDVFAKRVTPVGEQITPVVRLNETRLDWQLGPRVASDGRGRTFAVWTDESGRDGSAEGVYGRLLGPAGHPLAPEFLVNQTTLLSQVHPDLAADVAGRFVVVWQGKKTDDDDFSDVWARRFAATGEPLGDELLLNEHKLWFQGQPAVAMDSVGNFVVVWTAYDYPIPEERGYVIVARAYAADGTPLGGELVVDSDLAGFDESKYPSVALSDSGLFAVAWERSLIGHPVDGDSSDVRLRRFVWPCRADAGSLCLGGRFLVRAQQETTGSDYGFARAVALSPSAGAFWFFTPDNLELFVKVIDGCAVNQRFWVYAAGLTDRRVDLEVTDTWTGEVWYLLNEMLTSFPAVQDVEAFSGCGAAPPPAAGTPSAPRSPVPEPARSPVAATAPGGAPVLAAECVADERTLCLTGSRFRVTAEYRMAAGERGEGRAQPFGAESGLFWFFDADNPEVFVKVLDGCDWFGTYWVYAAGLTDLEVTLRVEDLESGQVRTWTNPLGTPFAPIHDAAAFATCGPGE